MPSSQSNHNRVGLARAEYDRSVPHTKFAARPPIEFQTYILGDRGVGITSLLQRLTGDDEPVDTVLKELQIRNQPIVLSFQRHIAKRTSHQADIVLLVCDLTNGDSLEHLREWYELVKPYFNEWTTLVVVGNKSDLTSSRVVSTMNLSELGRALHSDLTITTNATQSRNVTDLIELVSAKALSKRKSQTVEITNIDLTDEQLAYLDSLETIWQDNGHHDTTAKIRAMMQDYVRDCPTAISYTSCFWDRSWKSARPYAGTIARMLADDSLMDKDLYARLRNIPMLEQHPGSKLAIMLDLIQRYSPELTKTLRK